MRKVKVNQYKSCRVGWWESEYLLVLQSRSRSGSVLYRIACIPITIYTRTVSDRIITLATLNISPPDLGQVQ